MRRPFLSRSAVVGAVVLLSGTALLTACGSNSNNNASSPSPAASTPADTSSASGFTNGDVSKAPKVTGGAGERPVVAKPTGTPPTTPIVKDLKVGTGPPVTDVATTYLWNYEGVSWSTGKTFDSSFARGQAIPFALNQVIPCWTQGLQGIKPGGRRQLVCPPDTAYGAAGSPPAIGPNETLVFVVDLVGPAA